MAPGTDDLKAQVREELIDEVGVENIPDGLAAHVLRDPEMFRIYRDFREPLLAEGEIPHRLKLLMSLAILVSRGGQLEPCVIYATAALRQGSNAQEIREALRVALIFSGGSAIPLITAVSEIVDDLLVRGGHELEVER